MSQVTRREFIGKSALTVGAVPALSAFAYSQQAGANERLRVGLIGCGGMGRGDLKTFLNGNDDVDCVSICDVDPKCIEQTAQMVQKMRGHDVEKVGDFRRVIDNKDVDAVIVATPDHWHAIPTVLACQAGKDVYTEKPLGKCIDEGRAMLEAVKQNKRIAQMGTQWISGEHFREGMQFVQSGKAGKIRLVRLWAYLDWVGGYGNPPDGDPPPGVDYDMWLGPAPKRPFNRNRFHFNFRWFWDYAGGLMTDWGVHLFNIALQTMGLEVPKRVSSSGGKYVVKDNTETPDTQVAVYDFGTYTLIFEEVMVGGLGPGNHPHGMLFTGTRGKVHITANDWTFYPEPKERDLKQVTGKLKVDSRIAHIRNFIDCVKSRKQPIENLEIGHFVSTVAHLGNLAWRSGEEVHWDHENEKVINSKKADQFVGCEYRSPWKLPYARRI